MTDTVTIYCKNSNTYQEVPIGSSLLDIYKLCGNLLPYPPMNALVNNRTEALTYQCWQPKEVTFVDYTNQSGMRTYVRSLCLILAKAVHDLLPTTELCIEHAVSNGYYCTLSDQKKPDENLISQIMTRIRAIIDADLPFLQHTIRTPEAINLFEQQGQTKKTRLIQSTGQPYTTYCELDGYIDYLNGCLVPSTGYISLFDLQPYQAGLLLRVPQQKQPKELAPFIQQDKMFHVFKQHLELQQMLGLSNVSELNDVIERGLSPQVVMVSEAMQEKQIAKIAGEIADRYHQQGTQIVLISGPSSSGKTTFCKRLQVQLLTNMIHPVGISLDDYFLDREDSPKDESGDYDFESLYALDLPYFNQDLKRLLAGEEIDMPSYNFETGKREFKGKKLKMNDNTVLVIEGIHALNPELTAMIEDSRKFRIYISVLTTISLDNHNWIPTTDNRLLRRIIRDYQYRGCSARDTIARWPSVRRGENKWIFPYQENADAMFNSAMLYELSVLRKYAIPILRKVNECDVENAEAYRLIRFLRYFKEIPIEAIPTTSLLREFLGGGIFHY